MSTVHVPRHVCRTPFTLDLRTREIVADSGYRTHFDRMHPRRQDQLRAWMRANGHTFGRSES